MPGTGGGVQVGVEAGEVSMGPQGLAAEDLQNTHSAKASLDSELL